LELFRNSWSAGERLYVQIFIFTPLHKPETRIFSGTIL